MGSVMVDVDEFLDQLASPAPIPGGGSVAAFEVAMGAALLVMVCNLTLGRPKYAAVEDEVSDIRTAAEAIKTRARRLVDDDAEAFEKVAYALKLPRSTEEEKVERRRQLQSVLKGATLPPLETMKLAARGVALAAQLTPIGNKSAVSDVGSGAQAFIAGYHAANMNVEINLASIHDADFMRAIRSEVPSSDVIDEGRLETIRNVFQTINE